MKLILIIYCGIWLGLFMGTCVYSTRFSLYNTPPSPLSMNLVESLEGLSASGVVNTNNCFEKAIPCPSMGACDCQSLCGNRFTEVTVGEDQDVIFLDQKLAPGRYCLPDSFFACPRQFAYSLFDANGSFSCLCKYPSLFGGKFCNEKQACLNGVLIHRVTGTPISEADLKDENYYCKCFSDKNGNKRIHLPGDQLNCVSDPCLSLMVGASPGIGLTPQGHCDCGNVRTTRVANQVKTDRTTPCTSCFVTWHTPTKVAIPLKCLTVKGSPGYAPPCKDFHTNEFQCELLPPVDIEVISGFPDVPWDAPLPPDMTLSRNRAITDLGIRLLP